MYYYTDGCTAEPLTTLHLLGRFLLKTLPLSIFDQKLLYRFGEKGDKIDNVWENLLKSLFLCEGLGKNWDSFREKLGTFWGELGHFDEI